MKQPKTFTIANWSQSRVELLVLCTLTIVAGVQLLEMHWAAATALAPFVIFGVLLGVSAFVQVTWMLMRGLDKLGDVAGLRKSPMA